MTTINQLRLKRRVIASLPAAIASVLLTYMFLGLLGPAQGGTFAFGPDRTAAEAGPGRPGHTMPSGHRDTQFRFLAYPGTGEDLMPTNAGGEGRGRALMACHARW